MPVTVEKLRLGIVALAALLLLAIAASFLYGRWRVRHLVRDLPAHLGVQIQQSTQGFVLSQSNAQGRNIFTLHAARAIEFKFGGRVSLHNVKIDLYNRQTGRPDTIGGEDFEYDPHSEIVQAQGEAHIVLQSLPANSASALANRGQSQPIRITTHGLIFNRKTGVATCSGEVDFSTSAGSGQAVGAQFDSKQGRLLLESKVVLAGSLHDLPATLHASRATYDRGQGEIDLSRPRYTSTTPRGDNNGAADAATIFLRPDNSAERLDASGSVRLTSAGGMTVRAPSMRVLLSERNQPRHATFSGGVAFVGDQRGFQTQGNAQQTDINFDSLGHANRAILVGGVHFQQQAPGKEGMLRTLAADHLVLNVLPNASGQATLESADATGNAVFTSSAISNQPSQTTLAAQMLSTTFDAQNQPRQVDGTGQTRLRMVAENGDIDISTGDTLHIEFAPRVAGAAATHKTTAGKQTAPLAQRSIRSAVQTGHVVLTQTSPAKSNGAPGPKISTATAARANYVAENDTLTLIGDPVFRQGQLELSARRIQVQRAIGKIVSTGAVLATMESGSAHPENSPAGALLAGAQPVHIVAEQAVLVHKTQQAVFSGHARLWQGGDMVEAPVIELSQKLQTLKAYGELPCTQCVVSTFLAEQGMTGSAKPVVRDSMQPSVFRILAQKLLYSGAERKASFLHHVQVVSSAGQLTANQAEVYLTPSSVSRTNGQSSVEKIVATGHVRLRQPGRSATGSKLVYTSLDGHFVLTGNENELPEVADRDRGTVTGQVLTFASRDQAIMVSAAPGRTTTTRTRVQQK